VIAVAAGERLAWDAIVPNDAVKASVQDGHVALTGAVDWSFEKQAAEAAVRPLTGIVAAMNHVAIHLHSNARSISDDVRHALGGSWFFDPRPSS
jgi:osmotically-inducible protein OsmY